SRRRHTRCYRDWSSDVCSSDLLRHQDWVIKIDYRNGAGDGHVIWRLGQGGDFTVNSTDPNPWFSHQHNAHYIDDHTLILFDNGRSEERRVGKESSPRRCTAMEK